MDANQAVAIFFHHPFWTWIAIGGVFLIGELLTGSGWLLWPAGAAAVVAVVTRFADLGPGNIVLFVVVAIVATYLGRRYMRPAGEGQSGDINDPTPRLVGRQGEAVAAFKAGVGRVFVDGKEWAAELDGGGELAAKSKVEVTEILGGARLKVKAG
jgi:membrane protein implicated in regulation of membrane protease activity